MVPRVDTVAEATQIGQATRYPPVGQRGCGGNLISASGVPLPEYLQLANQCILTAIMMESGEARLDRPIRSPRFRTPMCW